jgi:hypothetical protein
VISSATSIRTGTSDLGSEDTFLKNKKFGAENLLLAESRDEETKDTSEVQSFS